MILIAQQFKHKFNKMKKSSLRAGFILFLNQLFEESIKVLVEVFHESPPMMTVSSSAR